MHNDQSTRQYIGFDTFDGFNKRDLDRDNHLSKDKWRNNNKLDVIKRCEDNNVEHLVELFEGDATETVPKILKNHKGKKFQPGKGKFALVYIDCNAYFPAIKSLENFLPYVVPGGLFVIDEKLQGGETEAILEFAKKNSLEIVKLSSNGVPITIKLPNK